MTSKTEPAKARQQRLAAELRSNLQKRKVQARARRSGEADERADGIGAAGQDGGASAVAHGDDGDRE